MSKPKSSVPAVTKAAGLAARALARLETEAAAVHASETANRARSLQLVSSEGCLHALIKHGRTVIQIEGDAFSVAVEE